RRGGGRDPQGAGARHRGAGHRARDARHQEPFRPAARPPPRREDRRRRARRGPGERAGRAGVPRAAADMSATPRPGPRWRSTAAANRAPRAALLDVERLAAGYGEMVALHDVSLQVRTAEIVALVGSNG